MNLIALVRRMTQVMAAELVERLEAAGYSDFTGAHPPLFENLDRNGTRLTVLAARAGMTHQSMGELVQALERRGYVERRLDPSDHRARLVRLTPRGKRMVARAIREIRDIERAWLNQLEASGGGGDFKAAMEATLLRHQTDKESAERGDQAPIGAAPAWTASP
jgi:DNA-binding MarR family transcriptional regulator